MGVVEKIKRKAVSGEYLYNEFELCDSNVEYRKLETEEYVLLDDVLGS